MEASTLQPAATLTKPRITIGPPLLRFRSDEQLVALFRAGYDEAFRAIHDRYHKRLFAYARQMLPGRQDAEDALQDVFVRAYSGLRASDRELALRAWLFRVAHNRCIDELRKPTPPTPEVLQLVRTPIHDPLVEVDLRESLRRVVEDIRRLPEQQRSALLMRELAGMSYTELASSLGISVGAVKSLLVRARLALAQASAARDTACAVIREQLVEAHDHGVRPNANARKHMRDCSSCKSFRGELRGVSRQLAATAPTIGPLGFLAKLLGLSGGGGAGGGVALLGGGGTTASAGGLAISVNHVATLIVAAVATAGGAVEIQHTILPRAGQAVHARSVSIQRKHAPAPFVQASGASAIQAATVSEQHVMGSGPTAALSGEAKPATTVAKPRPEAGIGRPRPRPAASVSKPKATSGSSTAAGSSTATTGTQANSSCTTAGSPAPTSDSSSTSSSTSSPTTTSDSTAPSNPSSSTSPTAGSACSSTAGSSSGQSTSSTDTSSSGSNSTTGSSGSTSAGSSSGTGTGPVADVSSPQGSSNATTG